MDRRPSPRRTGADDRRNDRSGNGRHEEDNGEQPAIRGLACFDKLAGHEVVVFHDTLRDADALAERLRDFDAVVLTRERTALSAALLDRLPRLRLVSQTGRISSHVDVAACTARGVLVADGQGSVAATAALTWALLLASRRHLVDESHPAQGRPVARPPGPAAFAAVDVFEREPVMDAAHPLVALPNALCTPHIGYVKRNNYEQYFGVAFDNAIDYAEGCPRDLVNPEVFAPPLEPGAAS